MENESPIGLKLLIAFYSFASVFSIYLMFADTADKRYIALFSALISIFILFGLVKRYSIARAAALVASWLVVISKVITMLLLIWLFTRANADNDQYKLIVLSTGLDMLVIALNVSIIIYLRKPHVRQLFYENS
jgi:hypothetical protein